MNKYIPLILFMLSGWLVGIITMPYFIYHGVTSTGELRREWFGDAKGVGVWAFCSTVFTVVIVCGVYAIWKTGLLIYPLLLG